MEELAIVRENWIAEGSTFERGLKRKRKKDRMEEEEEKREGHRPVEEEEEARVQESCRRGRSDSQCRS